MYMTVASDVISLCEDASSDVRRVDLGHTEWQVRALTHSYGVIVQVKSGIKFIDSQVRQIL